MLPFVYFSAKPNPASPAAEKQRHTERENLLPPFSSNSLFNFKVLYWQGRAWVMPRQLTKELALSKQKESKKTATLHYNMAKTTITTIIISIEIISISIVYFFLHTHCLRGVSTGFSFPLLLVMSHGNCCKHMWKQRGGGNGRLITANEFLWKWLGLFDCTRRKLPLSNMTSENRAVLCLEYRECYVLRKMFCHCKV